MASLALIVLGVVIFLLYGSALSSTTINSIWNLSLFAIGFYAQGKTDKENGAYFWLWYLVAWIIFVVIVFG